MVDSENVSFQTVVGVNGGALTRSLVVDELRIVHRNRADRDCTDGTASVRGPVAFENTVTYREAAQASCQNTRTELVGRRMSPFQRETGNQHAACAEHFE